MNLIRVIFQGSDDMSVFLVILKWVGIVAGGLVGFVLLLALLVVCVPVRYHLSGNNRDVICYRYRVSWMCRVVSVVKKMDSDAVWLKVFGIPVRCLARGRDRPKAKPGNKQEMGKKEKEDHRPEDGQSQRENLKPERQERTGETESVGGSGKKGKTGKKKKQKTVSQKKKFFSFNKLSSIINFMRTAENKSAFRIVWRELRLLIRYLAPRKVRGYLVIGTGDPSSTGLVIGGISLFPFAYQEGVTITPDFDEKILQAEGMIKGQMQVLYFLRLGIRLYRDQEIRKLWSNIQKLKKEAA